MGVELVLLIQGSFLPDLHRATCSSLAPKSCKHTIGLACLSTHLYLTPARPLDVHRMLWRFCLCPDF